MTILFLVVGGNLLLFYGFFSLLGKTVFKKQTAEPESDLQREMKQVEKELRML